MVRRHFDPGTHLRAREQGNLARAVRQQSEAHRDLAVAIRRDPKRPPHELQILINRLRTLGGGQDEHPHLLRPTLHQPDADRAGKLQTAQRIQQRVELGVRLAGPMPDRL
jgi:hypothetical protein